MERFKDKIVLITGASTGIGKAASLKFAAEGATVVLADVSDEDGQATLKEVQQHSPKSTFIHCDVADSTNVQQLIRQAIEQFGRIDVAVNNAGIGGPSAHTAEYSDEEWQQVININLTGV